MCVQVFAGLFERNVADFLFLIIKVFKWKDEFLLDIFESFCEYIRVLDAINVSKSTTYYWILFYFGNQHLNTFRIIIHIFNRDSSSLHVPSDEVPQVLLRVGNSAAAGLAPALLLDPVSALLRVVYFRFQMRCGRQPLPRGIDGVLLNPAHRCRHPRHRRTPHFSFPQHSRRFAVQ